MTINIKTVEKSPECMDCEKYSSNCDHLNNFIADTRKFFHDYAYDKDLELSLKIRCMNKKLCS
ncbi:MAG: hypothetical protein ACTSUE_18540 [Promethearchaeota archaeon]